jgi:hypothetical protein
MMGRGKSPQIGPRRSASVVRVSTCPRRLLIRGRMGVYQSNLTIITPCISRGAPSMSPSVRRLCNPPRHFNTSVEMPVENLLVGGNRPVFMRCSPLCTECGAHAFAPESRPHGNVLAEMIGESAATVVRDEDDDDGNQNDRSSTT